LFKLQKAKIPVVIIVGNHDHPLSFGKAHALDVFSDIPLSGIHVFSKPDVLQLKTKNGVVQIVGIPWPIKNKIISKEEHFLKEDKDISSVISEKIGMIIHDFASNLDPKLPAVLAGHLTVSNGIFSGSEKCAIFGRDPVLLPSQLAIEPFDYVALGHLHRYQNLNPNSDLPVVYSGSLERIDFGERKEAKGFCRVEIKDKKSCKHEFVEIKTRPMIQIEVELEKDGDQTEQIVEKIKELDIKDAIVKIIYHISDDTKDQVDLLAVQRECSDALCVASIIPMRKHVTKERSLKLNVSMKFSDVLDRYIELKKDDFGVDIKSLKEKAFKLYDMIHGDVVESNQKLELKKEINLKQESN